MRMYVCYLDFLFECIYKKSLGNAHSALCSTLPRLSWSWTVLLPSDTHTIRITPITAVLLPSVTYLLTLAPTRKVSRGKVWRKSRVWRLQRARKKIEQGICPIRSKDENWSHIVRCEEAIFWTRRLGMSTQKSVTGGKQDARMKSSGRI
jgi:hypothetical protein